MKSIKVFVYALIVDREMHSVHGSAESAREYGDARPYSRIDIHQEHVTRRDLENLLQGDVSDQDWQALTDGGPVGRIVGH